MDRSAKKRLIATVGGALMALATAASYGAGLGRITVNSALGQPLTAEIELVSLQPGELEVITAKTASQDAYRDAKVEFSPLLRSLRFTVDKRADGKPIVKITSSVPINEPFLDMLVEISWPSGRLLREYPILLDPPGYNEARTAPPQVAPSVATAKPVVPESIVPPVTAVPSAKNESAEQSDTYGPVKKGDTLNKIASETKPDSVSLEQMLVALYRENKAAFIGKNINRLRAGQILRVPTASEAARVTPAEAHKEIKVQVASWKEYREKVAGDVLIASAKPAVSSQSSGKIATAKPELPLPATTSNKDVLKLSKSDAAMPDKPGGVSAKGGNALQEQLTAMKEEAIARDNQLKEANSRVAALEKQIAEMRKLMELKASVPLPKAPETKIADPKTSAKTEPAKPVDSKPTDTKSVSVPVKTSDVKAEVKPPDTKLESSKPVDAKAADTTNKVADVNKVAQVTPPEKGVDIKTEVKPVDTKSDPAKVVKAPSTPDSKTIPAKKNSTPPPSSFVEENWVVLAAGGGAGVLAIGGLFLFLRRRKNARQGSSTGQMSSIMPSDLKPNTTTGQGKLKGGGGLVDTGNSSFLTDFDKAAGAGAIDTDEVDPVAEAEVYIAYGRDAQAEEILKEAMARDKNRHEVAVKLLEIYHTRKNAAAFGAIARELKSAIGDTHPIWVKVTAMGSQIDPGNALYGGTGSRTSAFDQPGMAQNPLVEKGSKPTPPPDLDFDLAFSDAAPGSGDAPIDITSAATGSAASSVDFDLGINSDLGDAQPSSASQKAPVAAPSATLDFDLGFDAPAAPTAASPSPAVPETAGNFDFNLSNLSLASIDTDQSGAQEKSQGAANSSAAIKSSDLNIGDISLQLDSPPVNSGSSEDSSTATKLELAKAYIEIGDKDGAKEILAEVVREGSGAQQEEAKKIMADL